VHIPAGATPDKYDWIEILIPVILITVTAMARSLTREREMWVWERWFLGLDIIVASIAASALAVVQDTKQYWLTSQRIPNCPAEANMHLPETLLRRSQVASLLTFTFFCVMFIVAGLHKKWDREPPVDEFTGSAKVKERKMAAWKRKRTQVLGKISNGLGLGCLALLVILRIFGLV